MSEWICVVLMLVMVLIAVGTFIFSFLVIPSLMLNKVMDVFDRGEEFVDHILDNGRNRY